MAEATLPTPEYLRQLLRYDPETGNLYWRERTPDLFPVTKKVPQHITCQRWNTTHAGNRADSLSGNGYRQINLFKRCFIAHRIVWAMHSGHWPHKQMDHANGNRSDNRIENLRLCTPSENMRNLKRFRNNTSGVTGVQDKGGRWVASISLNKTRIHLGSFKDRFDAVLVRLCAERQHSFSYRHGTAS